MRWQRSLMLAAMFLTAAAAHAGPPARFNFSFGIGPGFYPYHRHYYPYYRPYPIVVAAPPVVVGPTPVIVQNPPVVVQSPPVIQSVPSEPTLPPPTPSTGTQITAASISGLVSRLNHADANVRRDAVMQLGKLQAEAAVEPLTATLAGDGSPVVREAAARALGLIGSPRALTALIRAAQADNDRDVRHSAQFAVEVIQTRPARN